MQLFTPGWCGRRNRAKLGWMDHPNTPGFSQAPETLCKGLSWGDCAWKDTGFFLAVSLFGLVWVSLGLPGFGGLLLFWLLLGLCCFTSSRVDAVALHCVASTLCFRAVLGCCLLMVAAACCVCTCACVCEDRSTLIPFPSEILSLTIPLCLDGKGLHCSGVVN